MYIFLEWISREGSKYITVYKWSKLCIIFLQWISREGSKYITVY